MIYHLLEGSCHDHLGPDQNRGAFAAAAGRKPAGLPPAAHRLHRRADPLRSRQVRPHPQAGLGGVSRPVDQRHDRPGCAHFHVHRGRCRDRRGDLGRLPATDRRLRGRRVAARHHREPGDRGRLPRHRAARLRAAGGRARPLQPRGGAARWALALSGGPAGAGDCDGVHLGGARRRGVPRRTDTREMRARE
ncbi:hypothetical protein MICRO8M_110191 [Microbacterium sp. 8M]|nr:hypothetical protein MICRO8M_110191 [Microbacterium sp. 8M]